MQVIAKSKSPRLYRVNLSILGLTYFLLATSLWAQPLFEQVNGTALDWHTWIARTFSAGDYNNDGWPDVLRVQQNGGVIQLWCNKGDGTFAEVAGFVLPRDIQLRGGGGAGFIDYDNDGDQDLFLTNQAGPNLLLRNDRGSFTNVSATAGLEIDEFTDNAIWLDVDRDGWIDLYTGNLNIRAPDQEAINRMYRNRTDGTFEDITAAIGLDLQLQASGGTSSGMVAADLNDDNWPDLYVTAWLEPNRLFLSDGQGGYVDGTKGEIGFEGEAFGTTAGDFDGDGRIDLWVSGGGSDDIENEVFSSQLLLNLAPGEFINITAAANLTETLAGQTQGAGSADFDNDGDLDLFIADYNPAAGGARGRGQIYANNGDATFVNRADDSGIGPETDGPSYFLDYDLDGYQDGISWNALFHNTGLGNHWLGVVLAGVESNRDGIGARLTLSTAGTLQVREQRGGAGGSHDERIVHFGLGDHTQVERLEIRWPSGQVDVLEDIAADQRIRVIEGQVEYYPVLPTIWAKTPTKAVVVDTDVGFELAVRPALFEANAQITSVVADLSALGGPPELVLQPNGDGVYTQAQQVTIAGPNGQKPISVTIEQSTSLGPYWTQLSHIVSVLPSDQAIFAADAAASWQGVSDSGAALPLELYEASEAVALSNLFTATYQPPQRVESFGYETLRFSFHPGNAAQVPLDDQSSDLLFTRTTDGEASIIGMDADGTNQTNLSDNAVAKGALASASYLSPDGTKILFDSGSDGDAEIYVMDADGSNLVNLTDNLGFDAAPTWSPDGRKILFASDRDGPIADPGDISGAFSPEANVEIYLMDADGSNTVRLTDSPGLDYSPVWSPDGNKIAFISYRDDDFELYVMDPDGNNPVNLTNHPGIDFFPAWSPDGTKIAFTAGRGEGWLEIYVMDADGSNVVNLTRHPSLDEFPAWSPDGNKIAFNSNRDGNANIYVMDTDGGNLVRLTTDPGDATYPSWSPVASTDVVKFGVAINGKVVRLVVADLADIGVDLARPQWQEVEIPLAAFELDGPIKEVRFLGDLRGTVYLADIALVAANAASVSAVLEEHTQAEPQEFSLAQNWPNPFNSSTVIRFALPHSDEVNLIVYNMVGQQVASLVHGWRQAGVHIVHWDGRDNNDRPLASGIYLYRLQASAQVDTRKLLLLR